jgi:TRAP-type C4-dicarboxylate transport system permease large subunit
LYVSVETVFIAGIVPGVLTACRFMVFIALQHYWRADDVAAPEQRRRTVRTSSI